MTSPSSKSIASCASSMEFPPTSAIGSKRHLRLRKLLLSQMLSQAEHIVKEISRADIPNQVLAQHHLCGIIHINGDDFQHLQKCLIHFFLCFCAIRKELLAQRSFLCK
jgi:hypothetical protein